MSLYIEGSPGIDRVNFIGVWSGVSLEDGGYHSSDCFCRSVVYDVSCCGSIRNFNRRVRLIENEWTRGHE